MGDIAKKNCLLLVIRELLKMHLDNGGWIDIISKHKLLTHLGDKNVGFSNTQRSQKLQIGMHSIGWNIHYIH